MKNQGIQLNHCLLPRLNEPEAIEAKGKSRYTTITNETSHQWYHHKVKVIAGTTLALLVFGLIYAYRNNYWNDPIDEFYIPSVPCTPNVTDVTNFTNVTRDRFKFISDKFPRDLLINNWSDIFNYPCDEFNDPRCEGGKWTGVSPYEPTDKFCARVKLCENGTKIPGCIDGNYIHYLSNECKANPRGWNCAKIDYPKPPNGTSICDRYNVTS